MAGLRRAEAEYRRFAPVSVARPLVNLALISLMTEDPAGARGLLRDAAAAAGPHRLARELVSLLEVWAWADLGEARSLPEVGADLSGAHALVAARVASLDGDSGPATALLADIDRLGLDHFPGLSLLRWLLPLLSSGGAAGIEVEPEARRVVYGAAVLDLRRYGSTRRVLWALVTRRQEAAQRSGWRRRRA